MFPKPPLKYLLANSLDSFLVHLDYIQHIEMSEQPLTHLPSADSHRPKKLNIDNLFKFKCAAIIPPALGEPLADEF